ncbi:MAG: hypothetical protein KTR29_23190 [Rhodothermaceae bacterium]|nr:hypothetical protein [Rhodothermaceae bacterium]
MAQAKKGVGVRTQLIANILTMLVAVAAIGLSIWEGRENRLHNRLSVMPNLERIEFSNREGLSDSTFSLRYALYNSGLGPAVLQDLIVFREDSLIFQSQPEEKYYDFEGFVDDLHRVGLGESFFTHSRRAGELLRAGEEHLFFRLTIPVEIEGVDKSGLGYLRQEVLSKYSFVFCYCSVYGENCNSIQLGPRPPETFSCTF